MPPHQRSIAKNARLGETHFSRITTTMVAAVLVMRHLEFVTQALHPEWQVAFSNVTEHRTQFAVAGSRTRDLLNGALGSEIDKDYMPVTGCGPVEVAKLRRALAAVATQR